MRWDGSIGMEAAMRDFINVSNRLPVTVGQTIERSSGGLVAALEALQEGSRFAWVGWTR